MDERALLSLLDAVRSGDTSPEEAMSRLRDLPYQDMGFARFDTHRALRTGMEEVIFGPGKTEPQLAALIQGSKERHDAVLATRITAEVAARMLERFPWLSYARQAGVLHYRGAEPPCRSTGKVGVVTAGTADIPVAEEAAVTLEFMGHEVERINDVGVAGIHRLIGALPTLRGCRVLVVAAGMEGALPGVVAGLVDLPVIGVPTSVGLGAHLRGIAPLLTMLNTCAPGVAVVNVDGGFPAATMAHRIMCQGREG